MTRIDSLYLPQLMQEHKKNEILLAMVFMKVSSFGRELSTRTTHTSDFYIAFFTQLSMADIWEVREVKRVEKEWSPSTYSQLQNAVS